METLKTRSSGLLLHPTSLPSPHGIGGLGPEARRFAELLASAGQRWWQMLPVGPAGAGHSPYDSPSSFAGNSLLISPEGLVEDGLLNARDLSAPHFHPDDRVDFHAVARYKEPLLEKACAAFLAGRGDAALRRGYEEFCAVHGDWLDDFALFSVMKFLSRNKSWLVWGPELRVRAQHSRLLKSVRLIQYFFYRQWSSLRSHCEGLGVGLIGDVPIFVSFESADVWAHPELFELDASGRPLAVSGVPPDYFSEFGQLWGTPLYRWDVLREKGYAWWLARLRQAGERFGAVRLDHFIGFSRYWRIPAGAKDAREGGWVAGPGDGFFQSVKENLPTLEIIAEDLGTLTPEVAALRDRFDLPGMSVLQFGFEKVSRRCVIYTGTHDNDTTAGWFQSLKKEEAEKTLSQLGCDGREIHWDMIGAAFKSPADTAIVPVQDLLGLGALDRMNTPGTDKGNWRWRLKPGALCPEVLDRLKRLTEETGRLPSSRGAA